MSLPLPTHGIILILYRNSNYKFFLYIETKCYSKTLRALNTWWLFKWLLRSSFSRAIWAVIIMISYLKLIWAESEQVHNAYKETSINQYFVLPRAKLIEIRLLGGEDYLQLFHAEKGDIVRRRINYRNLYTQKINSNQDKLPKSFMVQHSVKHGNRDLNRTSVDKSAINTRFLWIYLRCRHIEVELARENSAAANELAAVVIGCCGIGGYAAARRRRCHLAAGKSDFDWVAEVDEVGENGWRSDRRRGVVDGRHVSPRLHDCTLYVVRGLADQI